MMKKLLLTLMCLIVVTAGALPAAAQTRNRRYRQAMVQQQSRYDRNRQVYYDYNGNRDNRSIWEQHRDKITTAGGAVGGALLGGLLGGKKGALLGAITGGAGAAVYTYKIRNKYRRY
jgi:outer membrane lipoprotein SlyB